MAGLIEDYALIGDLHTSALVSRTGSIDWLCLPRLDSDASFAALLGTADNGHWTISPLSDVLSIERAYRPDTLVLETTMTTAEGVVKLIDFMPIRHKHPVIIRLIEGVSGTVAMRSTLAPRFGYGRITPFYLPSPSGVVAQAGPDALLHVTPAHAPIEASYAFCVVGLILNLVP